MCDEQTTRSSATVLGGLAKRLETLVDAFVVIARLLLDSFGLVLLYTSTQCQHWHSQVQRFGFVVTDVYVSQGTIVSANCIALSWRRLFVMLESVLAACLRTGFVMLAMISIILVSRRRGFLRCEIWVRAPFCLHLLSPSGKCSLHAGC